MHIDRIRKVKKRKERERFSDKLMDIVICLTLLFMIGLLMADILARYGFIAAYIYGVGALALWRKCCGDLIEG